MRLTKLSRWLPVAVAALAVVLNPLTSRAEDKVLRIIGWEGYMDDSFTKAFEQKHH